MKIICWNCRGVGNPATVRDLKQLLVAIDPDIIFLCETKVSANRFDFVRRRCRMEGCLAVNAEGKSGGLVMMWKESKKVEIQTYSSNHIDALVHMKNESPIRFTGFYGNADPNRRQNSWNMLKRVGQTVTGKWIIGGDFNAILVEAEKDGGRRKPKVLMEEFRTIVDELAVVDLKTDNGWFTWVNNREGSARVKERLDRFLMSANAVNSFPFLETRVIRQSSSDHDAISLDTEGRRPRDGPMDPRLCFRYEVCWARNEAAKTIIKGVWQLSIGVLAGDIMDKLEKVGHDLGAWQFKRYKRMRRQIDALKSNINRLIDKPVEVYDGNKLKAMRIKLRKLLDREEQYWAQRSRVTWPKEWDRNTRFFHVRATSRKKKNRIEKLKDMHGNWRENTKDICEAARE
ncbi:hypothetical protein ES332_A09G039700v1, partial [Gossypium tomentosum]